MGNAHKQFGEIAIDMGFITAEQRDAALFHQRELNARGEHKLTGLILLEMGYIDNVQLIDVLKYYEDNSN